MKIELKVPITRANNFCLVSKIDNVAKKYQNVMFKALVRWTITRHITRSGDVA